MLGHRGLIQTADLFGVLGVSFLVAMAGAAIVEFLTHPLFRPTPSGPRVHPGMVWRLGLAAGLEIAAIAYGGYRRAEAKRVIDETSGPTVILVQTDIPQSIRNTKSDETWDAVWEVARLSVDRPGDLVVFPETSWPWLYGDIDPTIPDAEVALAFKALGPQAFDPKKSAEENGRDWRNSFQMNRRDLGRLAATLGKPVLPGSSRARLDSTGLHRFNASPLFEPVGLRDGREVGWYEKRHLVPFGEYTPFAGRFPILRILLPYESEGIHLDAGGPPAILHRGPLHFSSLICFEDTVPHLARATMLHRQPGERLDFFVNQSNDGWFRGSIESDYHLAAAAFRCIETRRPMVRAANMAVTAMVDSEGVVRDRLPVKAKDLLTVKVPLDPREAPYLTIGDALPWTCVAIVCLGVLASAIRHGARAFARLTAPRSTPANSTAPES
jgi:apolipoprotein N-acyltransferase